MISLTPGNDCLTPGLYLFYFHPFLLALHLLFSGRETAFLWSRVASRTQKVRVSVCGDDVCVRVRVGRGVEGVRYVEVSKASMA